MLKDSLKGIKQNAEILKAEDELLQTNEQSAYEVAETRAKDLLKKIDSEFVNPYFENIGLENASGGDRKLIDSRHWFVSVNGEVFWKKYIEDHPDELPLLNGGLRGDFGDPRDLFRGFWIEHNWKAHGRVSLRTHLTVYKPNALAEKFPENERKFVKREIKLLKESLLDHITEFCSSMNAELRNGIEEIKQELDI